MSKIKFIKMHSSGNDFIFLENINLNINQIKHLCDRNFGIGCDQLIIIDKIIDDLIKEIHISIFNSNGSIAKMCGNAMSCLCGLYLLDKEFAKIVIKHGLEVKISRRGNTASIEMPKISMEGDIINIGNLHKVFIITNNEEINYEISEEYNKNYIKILNENTISVYTIERGVGLTLGCGSGICASCYFIYNSGLITQNNINVITSGTEKYHNLTNIVDKISVLCKGNQVTLKRGWAFVCEGVFIF